MRLRACCCTAAVLAAVSSSCASPSHDPHGWSVGSRSDAVTSREATIVDFTFEGEIVAARDTTARDAVVRQLLYLFGILKTSDGASGQIGNVRLSSVRETPDGETKRIDYHARLPVAWPRGASPPASYEMVLPRDVTQLASFDRRYAGRCGNQEHGEGNYWHDWNPRAQGCAPAAEDVVRKTAAVTAHEEPQKRYPEYDRIWADDRLDVTAIFTIIDSATRPNDWAYTEAQRFLQDSAAPLEDVEVRRNPSSPSILSDLTLTGNVVVAGRPRRVTLDVLVVESVSDEKSDFDTRYEALSERADLVLFNGHARLGANTNNLSRKGKVVPGKYQVVLLNACDTFALVDTTMTDRRRAINGPSVDPQGTRFLDVISNAHPGRSDNLANVSGEVYRAALGADAPVSYGRIVGAMPKEHVVVVYGEEDNRFMVPEAIPGVYEDSALAGW